MSYFIILCLTVSNCYLFLKKSALEVSFNNLNKKYEKSLNVSHENFKFTRATYQKYEKMKSKIDWYKTQLWILEGKVRKTRTLKYQNYLAKLNRKRMMQFPKMDNYVLNLVHGSDYGLQEFGSSVWKDVPSPLRYERVRGWY